MKINLIYFTQFPKKIPIGSAEGNEHLKTLIFHPQSLICIILVVSLK